MTKLNTLENENANSLFVFAAYIDQGNYSMILLPSFLTSPLDLVNSANIVKAQMSGSPHRVPWDRQPY